MIPQFRAARVAGQMVAQGLLAEAEILPALTAATPPAARPPVLQRYRLAHDAMAAERRAAVIRVRIALAPLIAARASGEKLLAAARAAARTADGTRALDAWERRRLTEQAICRALGRRFR